MAEGIFNSEAKRRNTKRFRKALIEAGHKPGEPWHDDIADEYVEYTCETCYWTPRQYHGDAMPRIYSCAYITHRRAAQTRQLEAADTEDKVKLLKRGSRRGPKRPT